MSLAVLVFHKAVELALRGLDHLAMINSLLPTVLLY